MVDVPAASSENPLCPVLFTVGHSNHAWTDFLALLRQHAISDLVDVRSAPVSRYVPHANKRQLERSLPEHDMSYHFYGQSLGGRPKDPSVYVDGKIDYMRVMARDWFQAGLRDLMALVERVIAADGHTAIMCSERDPFGCHRHHLIARALLDAGAGVYESAPLQVAHILADGSLRPVSPDHFAAPEQLPLL